MNAALAITAVMAATGLLAAWVAFKKVKPERDSFLVSTAQGVVVMQSSILDEMQEEVQRVKSRADELEAQLRTMRNEQAEVLEERDYLRTQNEELHKQIAALERRVGDIEHNGPPSTKGA